MTPKELKLKRIEAFKTLAARELAAAKSLSGQHREQSAYFLQQSVEKLARGVLEVFNVLMGTSHNIRQMAELMDQDKNLSARFLALDELSIAATRYRYPGPQGQLSDISKATLDRLLIEVESLNHDVSPVLADYIERARNE